MHARRIVGQFASVYKLDAERHAQNWRGMGFSVRTFKRTVRAGGALTSLIVRALRIVEAQEAAAQ